MLARNMIITRMWLSVWIKHGISKGLGKYINVYMATDLDIFVIPTLKAQVWITIYP